MISLVRLRYICNVCHGNINVVLKIMKYFIDSSNQMVYFWDPNIQDALKFMEHFTWSCWLRFIICYDNTNKTTVLKETLNSKVRMRKAMPFKRCPSSEKLHPKISNNAKSSTRTCQDLKRQFSRSLKKIHFEPNEQVFSFHPK